MIFFDVFKILLVLLSIYGYAVLINKFFKVRFEFSIIVSICFMICCIFLFSLVNLLLLGTLIIFVSGLFYFLWYFCKLKLDIFKFENNKFYLLTFFLLLYLAIILIDIKMIHFDNFSHWAVIIKQMLNLNNLPDSTNILTSYVTYPPGSAYFIYYFCTIVGKSEYYMILAQAFLMIILLSSIYSFVKKQKFTNLILVFLYIVFVLTLNNSIYDLLADTLLGIFGFVSLSTLIYYKNDLKKAIILLIPINSCLLLIKNSAIFFFVINLLYIFYLTFKQRKNLDIKGKILTVLTSFVPFLIYSFWKIRNFFIFGDYIKQSSQNTSLSFYKNNFLQKNISDIIQVIKNFIKGFFNVNQNEILIFFIGIFIVFIIYLINKKAEIKIKKSVILAIISIYLLYNGGLLFGYIFSMTLQEALDLACYDRYLSSVIILVIGLVLIIYFNSEIKKKYIYFIFVIFFSVFILISPNLESLIGKQNYKQTKRYEIESILNNLEINNNNKYLIISSETKVSGYVTNVFKYYIFNKNYIIVSDVSALNNYNIIDYDYIITMDTGKEVSDFMSEYTDYNGKKGSYRVNRLEN